MRLLLLCVLTLSLNSAYASKYFKLEEHTGTVNYFQTESQVCDYIYDFMYQQVLKTQQPSSYFRNITYYLQRKNGYMPHADFENHVQNGIILPNRDNSSAYSYKENHGLNLNILVCNPQFGPGHPYDRFINSTFEEHNGGYVRGVSTNSFTFSALITVLDEYVRLGQSNSIDYNSQTYTHQTYFQPTRWSSMQSTLTNIRVFAYPTQQHISVNFSSPAAGWHHFRFKIKDLPACSPGQNFDIHTQQCITPPTQDEQEYSCLQKEDYIQEHILSIDQFNNPSNSFWEWPVSDGECRYEPIPDAPVIDISGTGDNCYLSNLDNYHCFFWYRSVGVSDNSSSFPHRQYEEKSPDDCGFGYIFNENTKTCDIEERNPAGNCISGVTHQNQKISGPPAQNANFSGCHAELQTYSSSSISLPASCYDATYILSGMTARSTDFNANNFSFCPNPPEDLCPAGQIFSYDLNECVDPANAPVRPPVTDNNLTSNQPRLENETNCISISGQNYCMDQENNPLPPSQYPASKPPASDICSNGLAGTGCNSDWRSGNYTSVTPGGTLESISDRLDKYNTLTGGYIDPFTLNYEELFDPFTRPPQDSNLSFDAIDSLENSRFSDSFSFGNGQCPPSETITFFEGYSFFDTSLQRDFHFEFDTMCAVGNRFSDLLVALFMLMIGFHFITTVARK